MRLRLVSAFCVAIAASLCVSAQKPARLSPRSNAALKAEKAAGDIVSAYITVDIDIIDRTALEKLGVKVGMVAGNTMTARIPLDALAEVSAVEGVKYVQVASPVRQMMDVAKPEVGGDKVTKGTSLAQAYTGKGVVVGVVDAGFDYTHAAFRDAGNNLRIKKVWDQKATATGLYSAPAGFGYGVELDTPEALAAVENDVNGNSHGSHVANIAAGSDVYMPQYQGMAPEADIVLVSLDMNGGNVCISDAVKYIFDYATQAGKPCVVNLSLGSHDGPHDGTSTFDVIADELQGEGRIIVGSAGNHRADKFHVSRVFGGDGDAPLSTFVTHKASVSSTVGGVVEIWAEKAVEVSLVSYRTSDNAEEARELVYPEAGSKEVTLKYITGSISVNSEISPLNGKHHVLVTSNITQYRTQRALAIEVKPKEAGQVDIWADNTKLGLESKGIEGFTGPTTESTIAEIGGTGKRILTVGAYTTRNEYTLINQSSVNKLNETVGDISSFSSYGPTADGRMKPAVAAPGCFIVSAVSNYDSNTSYLAAVHEGNGRYNRYAYMQGTSMSAPLVTGIVATWLEACPTLTPEQLLEVVKNTAHSDSYTGSLTSGSNDWGYGKIDAYEGLKKCVEIGSSGCVDAASPFDGEITMHGGCINIAFPSGARYAVAKVFAANGTMLLQKESRGSSLTIGIESLPKGVYLLQVSVGGSVKVVKFSV